MGKCRDDGTCLCNSGMLGESCEFFNPSLCTGKGETHLKTCLCMGGYGGADCASEVVCSGNGQFLDTGVSGVAHDSRWMLKQVCFVVYAGGLLFMYRRVLTEFKVFIHFFKNHIILIDPKSLIIRHLERLPMYASVILVGRAPSVTSRFLEFLNYLFEIAPNFMCIIDVKPILNGKR